MMPVRPPEQHESEPPPRRQRTTEGGVTEEPKEQQCDESDIASPTSVAEGDVGNMRDVEKDAGQDESIDDEAIIEITEKDDEMAPKLSKNNLDPF